MSYEHRSSLYMFERANAKRAARKDDGLCKSINRSLILSRYIRPSCLNSVNFSFLFLILLNYLLLKQEEEKKTKAEETLNNIRSKIFDELDDKKRNKSFLKKKRNRK